MIKAAITPGFRPLEITVLAVLLACFALASCYMGMDGVLRGVVAQQEQSQHSADAAFKSCLVGNTIRTDTTACRAVARGIIQIANKGE